MNDDDRGGGGGDTSTIKLETPQDAIIDKSREDYQRSSWEALKESIYSLIGKATVSNLPVIVRELLKENLIRGAGVLCQSLITAQSFDPSLTHVYAALVAVLNSKLPQIGKILIARLIEKLRKSYVQNDKEACIDAARFIAHLFNQNVVNELLALEILTFLIENPTTDCIEIAVSFLKDCGAKLQQSSPKGFIIIFGMLRKMKGKLDTRAQCAIEMVIAIRKDSYKDYPIVIRELDLLKVRDKITHEIELGDKLETEDELNVFQFDPDYLENEEKYKTMKAKILDYSIGSVSLQRKLYLNLQSSLQPEETAHKLIKLKLEVSDRTEMCTIIVDCCVQQRTYNKSHGLIVQNLCSLSPDYVSTFSSVFVDCLTKIDRFQNPTKIRNAAKFASHLLTTDSIPWKVLSYIKLNEGDTSTASRAFIEYLFQELADSMGIKKLGSIIKDATLGKPFPGILSQNTPNDTRFSASFFTQIGLGPLVEDLKVSFADKPTVDSDKLIKTEENRPVVNEEQIT